MFIIAVAAVLGLGTPGCQTQSLLLVWEGEGSSDNVIISCTSKITAMLGCGGTGAVGGALEPGQVGRVPRYSRISFVKVGNQPCKE